jgi:transposase
MARALSVDLRHRVAAAIVGGLSRRQAAVRFGVSAASAVRWQQLAAEHGTPGILSAWEATPDITLAELQALLADHGTKVAIGTLWRFFNRRGITRKKDGPRDRAGPS